MANSKQALKRHRQAIGRADRNIYYKSTARTLLKLARTAIADGDKSAAEPAVRKAISYLDHICTRGVYPKPRVNRLKSRLSSQFSAL